MKLIEHFNTNGRKILPIIKADLKKSIQRVISRCATVGNIAQEPDYIADLVINFSKDLHENLKDNLQKFNWSVTGVYCHQKPIVDIGLDRNPELGDLMILYIHTDEFGVKHHNSLLFQAKMVDTISYTIPDNELHQLKLYEEWPDFIYRRAGLLNNTKRIVQPKTHHAGGNYLLISPEKFLNLPYVGYRFNYGVALPCKQTTLSFQLELYLIHFLKFIVGRTIHSNPKVTNDHWSKMIWELIEIGKQKVSRRKNSGISDFPRVSLAQCDGLAFIENTDNSIFYSTSRTISTDGNDEEYYESENSDGGISMIVIESESKE